MPSSPSVVKKSLLE